MKGADMKDKKLISRRDTLKGIGAVGAGAILGSTVDGGEPPVSRTGGGKFSSEEIRKAIFDKVAQTPLIDTHEHLIEESDRLAAKPVKTKCDDWSITVNAYTVGDLISAGMAQEDGERFFTSELDPMEKWRMIEPYWPAVKNTGYGQVVRITMKQLYGVDELSGKTIKKVISGYEKTRKAGFYKKILRDMANIESCQVNYMAGEPSRGSADRPYLNGTCLASNLTTTPFKESAQPTLLMQDISFLGMYQGPDFKQFGDPTGIKFKNLYDWHKVIDWWLNKYGKYAVAVKSQNAYNRDIDYERVEAEKVEAVFLKVLNKRAITDAEKKALEDHLFWYSVKRASESKLPVKLHTGYYAGANKMPLSRLINNPGSATDLCRAAPETRFVFMHICYPYYEEMISIAKQYTNAYIDMCWAWIINPVAAKDFLKKYLVTAPANKILTFGGDLIGVEAVLGHAVIARRGIAIALSELVEEGQLSLDEAIALKDPIMHGNAREIFNLVEKEKVLKKAEWV